jgi:hypothetical protein
MFLGSRVDDAMSHYYRTLLESGERLALPAVQEFYEHSWREELARERGDRGVDFSELHERAAFEMGLAAVAMCMERFVPTLGEPVAVQRRFEVKLTAAAGWTIQGYPDLEVRRYELGSDEPIEGVVDWKVKGDPIHQQKADRDVQASLYLAVRWIEQHPRRSSPSLRC